MKDYFKLQYTLINRRLSDYGIPPIVFSWIILAVVFSLAVQQLFLQTDFASYLVVFAGVFYLHKLSSKGRNEFLKTTFPTKQYQKIRLTENLLVSLPFITALVYYSYSYEALGLFIVASILSVTSVNISFNRNIPTPFQKRPFEFIEGFRKTVYLFPFLFILTGIAVYVGNFNLGAFAVLCIYLTTATYYLKPENEYFVWCYKLNSRDFLIKKIKTALLQSIILPAIPLATLAVFFPENSLYLLLASVFGWVITTSVILAKYAAFPNEIGLQQGILLGISIYFPPIFPFSLWYFWKQSQGKLKPLLDD